MAEFYPLTGSPRIQNSTCQSRHVEERRKGETAEKGGTEEKRKGGGTTEESSACRTPALSLQLVADLKRRMDGRPS